MSLASFTVTLFVCFRHHEDMRSPCTPISIFAHIVSHLLSFTRPIFRQTASFHASSCHVLACNCLHIGVPAAGSSKVDEHARCVSRQISTNVRRERGRHLELAYYCSLVHLPIVRRPPTSAMHVWQDETEDVVSRGRGRSSSGACSA